jgi:YidC/Oxa1 family membrane protein insertase
MMDKRTIIGIVLIVVITLMMPFYQKWITGDKPPTPLETEVVRDTVITKGIDKSESIEETFDSKTEVNIVEKNDTLENNLGIVSEIEGSPNIKLITIENDFMKVIYSTKNGGNPVSWELKEYQHYSGNYVDLINQNGLNINFLNVDGKEVDLNKYNLYTDLQDDQSIYLDDGKPEFRLEYYLPIKNGRIIKAIQFYSDKYSFDLEIKFENLHNYIINRKFAVIWQNGLPVTERNVNDDLNYSRAYVYLAEELENIDAKDKYAEMNFNGIIDWVSVRSKYFLASIIPSNPRRTSGATIAGIKNNGNTPWKNYNVAIDVEFEPVPVYEENFTVYLGPLDYYKLNKYDVDLQKLVMNKDWYERLFRPISLLIIPIFKFLYRFIPNYGFVIIVFSILIKLLLHPLTKKSYQSMSEMQYLQPKMNELREKYKNEPQRVQKEMMKLYKEHGVNPLGGCLPMLLQMPVLFSLFIVFRSTIQLRGQPFIFWINDLASPDMLYLGVSLPFIGNNLHVLPILMGVTNIWQSKMTMTDPKQKMMVYFMPIFLIFIFYSLPSGLNLYYAIFNVLSMIQTRQIKKKMHPNAKNNQTQNNKPVKQKSPSQVKQ